MYSYKKVEGDIFSDKVDGPLFEKFLDKCKDFWKPIESGK